MGIREQAVTWPPERVSSGARLHYPTAQASDTVYSLKRKDGEWRRCRGSRGGAQAFSEKAEKMAAFGVSRILSYHI